MGSKVTMDIEAIITGALYDFGGFLSSRPVPFGVGASMDATHIVDAIEGFRLQKSLQPGGINTVVEADFGYRTHIAMAIEAYNNPGRAWWNRTVNRALELLGLH